jgi:hypothetical protein
MIVTFSKNPVNAHFSLMPEQIRSTRIKIEITIYKQGKLIYRSLSELAHMKPFNFNPVCFLGPVSYILKRYDILRHREYVRRIIHGNHFR